MTDAISADPAEVEDGPVHDEHFEEEFGHATDKLYIQIAFILAAMTAMEVSWPYIVDALWDRKDGLILVVPMLTVMAIKFGTIAWYFMHLKYDTRIVTRVFYAGLFLAVAVYTIALSTFHFFRS